MPPNKRSINISWVSEWKAWNHITYTYKFKDRKENSGIEYYKISANWIYQCVCETSHDQVWFIPVIWGNSTPQIYNCSVCEWTLGCTARYFFCTWALFSRWLGMLLAGSTRLLVIFNKYWMKNHLVKVKPLFLGASGCWSTKGAKNMPPQKKLKSHKQHWRQLESITH